MNGINDISQTNPVFVPQLVQELVCSVFYALSSFSAPIRYLLSWKWDHFAHAD